MKNSKRLFNDLVSRVTIPETTAEKQSMIYLLLASLLGLSRSDILTEKEVDITKHEHVLEQWLTRLNKYEPVQYILGEAQFFSRTFFVNEAVLIPRPETEELVQHVLTHRSHHQEKQTWRILDIGTGSGCIPITLALAIPQAEVFAVDVSKKALEVAKKNAEALGASVVYQQVDILTQDIALRELDIVISNPPYITESERGTMANNVVNFEPHIALFVTDSDPLIFYKAIVKQAVTRLNAGGLLIFEINESFGREVAHELTVAGFIEVCVLKDITGKDRMVKGILPFDIRH